MIEYRLALVGKNVSNSPSPKIHRFIMQKLRATCSYETLSLSEDAFSARAEELFSAYDGLNVTMPYKRSILPYLTRCDEISAALSSVNTVKTKGRVGYNTDLGGFSWLLSSENISPCGMRALVLGAGGAGRSVIRALSDSKAEVFVYEKDPLRLQKVFSDLGGFTPLSRLKRERFDLIVNCTGVGMHETEGRLPLVLTEQGEERFDETFFSGCSAAVDLIYDPALSAFLKAAKNVGIRGVNGKKMLFFQAYLADCIFLNREGNFRSAQEIQRQFEVES